MTRLWIRIDFDDGQAIGPGKIRLLELIQETGSISAAGRAMQMSYRRAWLLIDELNQMFRTPVVATQGGGVGGGGATVTPFGEELIATYRNLDRDAQSLLARRGSKLDTAREKSG